MSQSTYRRRERLRLQYYDYSQYGCYFVTICTQNRQCIFGEIINKEMQLNILGAIAEKVLLDLTVD